MIGKEVVYKACCLFTK